MEEPLGSAEPEWKNTINSMAYLAFVADFETIQRAVVLKYFQMYHLIWLMCKWDTICRILNTT